jgi:hypothetical protein
MTRHERVGIAVVLGVSVGLLIAVCTWILLSNQARIGEIQDSRISGSEIACQQQNERHERAYAKIEAAAAIQRIKNPDRYRATVAKARELETFLNAIQPQEDCSLRARRLIVQTLGQNHAKPRKPVRKPGPLRLPPL